MANVRLGTANKKQGRFEVYKGGGVHPFRFRWVASNGRNVARSSEGYKTKRAAMNAAMALKYGALTSEIEDKIKVKVRGK